jgi:integrase
MSRRKGQNPKVRVGQRVDGTEYYFIQFWVDVPGVEGRQRKTEVLGLVEQMTKSEAERKKLEIISKLDFNSSGYRVPSSKTFADAVEYYRTKYAPTYLRDSTFSVADGRIRNHLETDWGEVPIEHIDIDSANEWAAKKRKAGLSWTTIKDALRTMQGVLSAYSKGKEPPFSQKGLKVPERDKLQMGIGSRNKQSLSWVQAEQITDYISRMDTLGDSRRQQYSTLILSAAASGLRCGELLALRVDDIDFEASTIRVDESSDQRNGGALGPCKNVTAYRIKQAGLHALRRGCNRRWELAGIVPAVIRQQMGHTTAAMTRLYSGEIPIEQVRAAFSTKKQASVVELENMENENAARELVTV